MIGKTIKVKKHMINGMNSIVLNYYFASIIKKAPFGASFYLERITEIESATSAWEADVLPLNYIRNIVLPFTF